MEMLFAQESEVPKEIWEYEGSAALNRRQFAQKASSTGSDYDLTAQKLVLNLNPDSLFVQGKVVSQLIPIASALDTVTFDLNDNLLVDSVLHNQTSVAFQAANDLLKIPLLTPWQNHDSITVFYHGIPDGQGFGSFATGGQSTGGVLWTLSEPYGAPEWWPCKSTLDDKIDSLEVVVTVPAGNQVGTNGTLLQVDSLSQPGLWTWHWRHNHPIPTYLVAVAVSDYLEYRDTVPLPTGPLEMVNFVYPYDEGWARQATSDLIPPFVWLDSLLGPYPYFDEKYGHAQFGWGGGMEHATMSFVGGFGEELLIHELVHQWFGDKVTCGSWQDIWLNEGFATYLTGMSYERFGDSTEWRNWKQISIDNVVSEAGGSVYVDDTTDVWRIFSGRLSYNKGALVLHMLRWTVGDSAFFAGLRNYLADPGLAWGFAKSPDLQSHLEQSSGQSLQEFFEDWVYGEGYPTYEVAWEQDGDSLLFSIYQTTSHASVDFFEMPVTVGFLGENGEWEKITVQHDSSGQNWSVPIGFAVEEVRFDPDLQLISRDNRIVWLDAPEVEPGTVEMFPNPAGEIINIWPGDPSVFVTEVNVFDLTGRHLRQNAYSGGGPIEYETGELPQGLLIFRVLTNKGYLVQRIWLEKP